jgi:glutamate-1-semialdehyde 2,1-aminomutase
MKRYPQSSRILVDNRKYIPGGAVSLNRVFGPDIVFVRAEGSRMWDADGNEYIDYHGAFAPHFLGHNDRYVTDAVHRVLHDHVSLFGAGTTELEGRLAKLICDHIPFVDSVQILNTGSEATYQAIRIARAAKRRDHVIVMQGGYNGWHNDVAYNLMTPVAQLGSRVSPGEYPLSPITAGIPETHRQLIHAVNFNDLDSIRWVCERYPVACVITEPVLQNIGIVHPLSGYLAGLRQLADEFDFVLIFDEVKTGFRYGLGGYAAIAGVYPDLVTYGKALGNGYPIAAIAGKSEYMNLFIDPDPARRVLLAGTYNGHPVAMAAAIATIERLLMDDGEVYAHTEHLGEMLEAGLHDVLRKHGIQATLCRQGSAFCLYLMDHSPVDWHDIAVHHLFTADEAMRFDLIDRGIYMFPLAAKQGSISAAHSEQEIARTLEAWDAVLASQRFRTCYSDAKVVALS